MQDNKKHLYTIICVIEHLIIHQTNKDNKEKYHLWGHRLVTKLIFH